MENNKMISFGNLVEECFNEYDVYIPLLQRNYKWEKEIAKKLAGDLYKAYKENKTKYTAGMITLYEEEDKKMQLIDGQQRMITLFMILKCLEPDTTHFRFRFERDDGIAEEKGKRFYYLERINDINGIDKLYTDTRRFKENYDGIKSALDNNFNDVCRDADREAFREYIFNNLYLLLHISDVEPFDEFINLNKNKTRFVISDSIKANLIIDSDEVQRKQVLNLFKGLSKILYYGDDKNVVWNLVKQGYVEGNIPNDLSKRDKKKWYSDENRLKLLCCERYEDSSGRSEYERNKEYEVLERYKNILNKLKEDAESGDWSSYNGFDIIYNLMKENFFALLKNDDFEYIEEYYKAIIEKEKDRFNKACFIESQLSIEKTKDVTENYDMKKEFKDDSDWINTGNSVLNEFIQIYDDYIREKYEG